MKNVSIPVGKMSNKKIKKIQAYIYDIVGTSNLVFDKILNQHSVCYGHFEGDTIVFACYSCLIKDYCYWITNKDKLKKDGVVYRE